MQPPMTLGKHKRLAEIWQKSLDPYPFLPTSSMNADLRAAEQNVLRSTIPTCRVVCKARTWEDIGEALLDALSATQQDENQTDPVAISIWFPEEGDDGANENGNAEAQPDVHRLKLEDVTADPLSKERPTDTSQADHHTVDVPVTAQAEVNADEAQRAKSEDANGKNRVHTTEGQESTRIPMRKRTSSAAGLAESPDVGRLRSKRIRARESLADAAASNDKTAMDVSKQYDAQLEDCAAADELLFQTTTGLMKELGVSTLGTIASLQKTISQSSDATVQDLKMAKGADWVDQACRDLYTALQSWDPTKQDALLGDREPAQPKAKAKSKEPTKANSSGLAKFLEYTKDGREKGRSVDHRPAREGLRTFIDSVNQGDMCLTEASIWWLMCLLSPNTEGMERMKPTDPLPSWRQSSYLRDTWSDKLRRAVQRMLACVDEDFYRMLRNDTERLIAWSQRGRASDADVSPPQALLKTMGLVQATFELGFDIYSALKSSDKADAEVQVRQRDRLDRWAAVIDDLADIYLQLRPRPTDIDDLFFRYLWASAVHAVFSEENAKEFTVQCTNELTVQCMNELKMFLQAAGSPVFELPNSVQMPEISVAAAEQRISKIFSRDYFREVFESTSARPVFVIERLEPVLDSRVGSLGDEETAGCSEVEGQSMYPPSSYVLQRPNSEAHADGSLAPRVPATAKFLGEVTSDLRVLLWNTLGEAYEEIDYPTKVLSCHLRCIEVIMEELGQASQLQSSKQARQLAILKCLQTLDEHLRKALMLAVNAASPFECIDYDHVKTSVTALGRLARLLHVTALFEDSIRVGRISQATLSPASISAAMEQLRDMQVRTWTLLFTLLKEGLTQRHASLASWSASLAQYLSAAHQVTGLRGFCGASHRLFLKFMALELFRLDVVEDSQTEILQILYDVYDMKLGMFSVGVQDHGCVSEPLDRRIATHILGYVLSLLRRLSAKDLSKPEYKNTIDKLQATIGGAKSSRPVQINLRVFNSYMKSTINPRDLYKAMRGLFELTSVRVPDENSSVARTGWYYFLGHMALARFRAQKRASPGPMDDLMTAASYLKLDLQYDMDKWETWYRLAQTNDSLLEEEVLWSADKMNGAREELNTLQRNAIHCYTMAISCAIRSSDTSLEMAEKLSCLFTDFGTRIYASSRAPFDMAAFAVDDFPRIFSGAIMYQSTPHPPLSEYHAWKFASVLFDKAISGRPDYWM